MKQPLYTLLGIAAIFCHSAVAQNAVTPPVGAQTTTLSVGRNAIGFPLLNPDLLTGVSSGLSGNALSISGQTNIGALLSSGEPYYVEVCSGALKGDRFDVDTEATIASADRTIKLDSTSANNSLPAASIGAALDNAAVTLRQHITIERVQSYVASPLVGNNSASRADQISFYDNSANGYLSYYLRGDGTTWRRVGTTQSANKKCIPPGVGVFIEKKSSSAQLVEVGAVRLNDCAISYATGDQLVAPVFPVAISPSSLGATSLNGWTGSNSQSNADRISVYNPSIGGYDTYYLRADGSTWRKVGTTTVVTATDLVQSSQSFFVSRKKADSITMTSPILP